MKVDQFKITKKEKYTRVSARFTFVNPDLNKTVWFTLPTQIPTKSAVFDAFFILAVPLAYALNEDLDFKGIVSTQLYRDIHKIKPFINQRKSEAHLKVVSTQKRKKGPDAAGLFFSMGIDSFHSLLDASARDANDNLTYLIFIKGCELYRSGSSFYTWLISSLNKIAKATHATLLIVETNLRDLTDQIMSWNYYHGAAIAGSGMFFSHVLSTLYISSCDEYLLDDPWGTALRLDPLWSTEGVSIKTAGYPMIKVEKAEAIVKSPHRALALSHIWTCWKQPAHPEDRNCGRCEKCLRGLLCFKAVGYRENIPSFPPLTVSVMEKIDLRGGCLGTWQGIRNRLRRNGNLSPELMKVLEKKIENNKRWGWIEKINLLQ
ncbi:MAG: hypothetical protein Q7S61_00595 [bacterium]|nr:hypothetical protein [bacterium]